MIHPWWYISNELKSRGITQKQFSDIVWKKISEVSELINWKRNITIQWDILLSVFFDDQERKWLNLQIDYDYYMAKSKLDFKKLQDIRDRKKWTSRVDVFSDF